MIYAVDFDGSCVTHEYPEIGQDIGAVPVLRRLVEHGHKLVLNTMRSGEDLDNAVNWFAENDIPLYGVGITPGQRRWTASTKTYADYYIDDAALGTPLTNVLRRNGVHTIYRGKPFIDWEKMEALLEETGAFEPIKKTKK
jgi:hypothetical protein